MSIKFTPERMQKAKESASLWWEGKLDRPLFKLTVMDAYEPDVPKPKAPLLSQSNCHDFSYTPEEVIEAFDYQLSQQEYLGDAFPLIKMEMFGPGILAVFCGARFDNSSGRPWFFPSEELEISDIHVKYNPDNEFAMRIKDIYRAGLEKWGDTVIMALPDIGGVMDILATLRDSNNLLFDLYDYPEEVTRVIKEIEQAWDEAYNDFTSVLGSGENGYGYVDWVGIYSETPAYVTQCDFAYMISNDMFKEFVLPSLEHHCEFLDRVLYHLDGVGELIHLTDILALDGLNAVQWVPGAGQAPLPEWVDNVYKPIQDAGKGIHFIGNSSNDPVVNVGYVADMYKTINKNIYYFAQIKKEILPEFKEKTKDMFVF